jgi:hypothetical protein
LVVKVVEGPAVKVEKKIEDRKVDRVQEKVTKVFKKFNKIKLI